MQTSLVHCLTAFIFPSKLAFMDILFEVILNVFQAVMMVTFMRKVTKPKREYGSWIDVVFCFAIAAVLSTFTFFSISIPETTIFLLPLSYTVITRRSTWPQRIVWTVILGAVMTYVSVIMIVIFDLFGVQLPNLTEFGITRIGFTVTSNIAMAIILFCISRTSNKHVYTIIPSTTSVILVLLLISQFVSAELFYISQITTVHHEVYTISSIICAFASSIITFILYETIKKAAEKRHKQEMKQQTVIISRKYQEDIGAVYNRMLIAQHDLKHQIELAQSLLEHAGLKEDSTELINAEMTSSIITTGCISADAVLTAKKDTATKNGIVFDFEPFPLNPLPINEMDFCILLTNILDNAIEGALHSSPSNGEKYIHLHFRRAWNMFNIVCRNSADPATVCKNGDRFISFKQNTGLHGLGTESIYQTVSDYNGSCDFSLADGVFSVSIVIPDAEV